MSKLALLGGDPVRRESNPEWPVYSTNEEAAAVLAALRSDHLCGLAGEVFNSEFESAFAMGYLAPGAVSCNSGSSALQVALDWTHYELQESIEQPARRRAHSGRFSEYCSIPGCSSYGFLRTFRSSTTPV